MNKSGLSVAEEKTQFIIFSRNDAATKRFEGRNQQTISYELVLSNITLQNINKVKFLGLTFQSNLGWNQHSNCIIRSTSSSMRTLRCLAHTWWGADPYTMLTLFRVLIRSRLEYATFLLHRDEKDSFSAKADKIQLRGLRIAKGYRQSTPTNVIFMESKFPPMKIRNRYLGKNYLAKVLCAYEHPLVPLFREAVDLIEHPTIVNKCGVPMFVEIFREIDRKSHLLPSSVDLSRFTYDYREVWFCPDINTVDGISLKNELNAENSFQKVFEEELKSPMCLFTDGSRMQNVPFTGFAVCTSDGSMSYYYSALQGFSPLSAWNLWPYTRHYHWQMSMNGTL